MGICAEMICSGDEHKRTSTADICGENLHCEDSKSKNSQFNDPHSKDLHREDLHGEVKTAGMKRRVKWQ